MVDVTDSVRTTLADAFTVPVAEYWASAGAAAETRHTPARTLETVRTRLPPVSTEITADILHFLVASTLLQPAMCRGTRPDNPQEPDRTTRQEMFADCCILKHLDET